MSRGTGFIFTFSKGEFTLPALITNKHVVSGAQKTQLAIPYIHSENGHDERRSFAITIKGGESVWVKHPESAIDLCALPLQSAFDSMKRHDPFAHHISLDESLIPDQEELEKLSPFEDVVMIGYPIGLIDEAHNAPLMRKGVTASHPKYDFNNNPIFLIDCACFPGSSGSPVFLLDNGLHVEGSALMLGQRRFSFLGILYSGPIHRATGEIEIVDIPTSKRAVPVTNVMANLGNVIKSRKLKELGRVLWELAKNEISQHP